MLRSPDSPNSEVHTILRNRRTRFNWLPRLAAVVLAVTALAISPLATQAFGISEKTLTPIYRHWIHQEVNYIITRAERNEFLALKTDDERDKFIERFWELRNPSPGPLRPDSKSADQYPQTPAAPPPAQSRSRRQKS